MYRPEMAFAIGTASRLYEAIVQRQIVTNRIAPTGSARPKIRIIVEYVLIDVGQHQFGIRRT